MLYKDKNSTLIRAQGAWISNNEILNIISFIEEHSKPQYDDNFTANLGRVKEATSDDPFASLDEEQNTAASAAEKTALRETVKAAAAADDEKKAIEVLINTKRASVSNLQRNLRWGYNHAAQILDMLADKGIVTKQDGKLGPRTILFSDDQLLKILNGESDIDGNADDCAYAGEDGNAVDDGFISGSDMPPAEDDFTEEMT